MSGQMISRGAQQQQRWQPINRRQVVFARQRILLNIVGGGGGGGGGTLLTLRVSAIEGKRSSCSSPKLRRSSVSLGNIVGMRFICA
jgi:hypothetical protein